jgi:hypothetical protein
LRFAAEAREPIGIVRDERRQDFQRDGAIELGVMSAIDLAHAAGAEKRIDRVRSDARALGQRHGLGRHRDVAPSHVPGGMVMECALR